MTTNIGDIATGHESVVKLVEEVNSNAGYGAEPASSTAVWLMWREFDFQKIPSIVQSSHAASNNMGYARVANESAMGSLPFKVDLVTIPRILKWIMGNLTTTNPGAGTYKHAFKFGSSIRSFRAWLNEGGLATPLYSKYTGLGMNRLSFHMGQADDLTAEFGCVGKTRVAGAAPGTPSFSSLDLTIGYKSGFTVYNGTAGVTALASMSQIKDPYDMTFTISRPNMRADIIRSDGTGQTNGIFGGTPECMLDFQAQFTSENFVQAFEDYTHKAFGIKLDTGVAIPAGDGSNYRIEMIFPRCLIKTYTRRATSENIIIPGIYVVPMTDPTAGYEVEIDVYNGTSAYGDST